MLKIKQQQIELNEIYNKLHTEGKYLLDNLNKDRTKLIITKNNDKIYVYIKQQEAESGKNCLNMWHEYYEEYRTIKKCCDYLEQDLREYSKYIDNLNTNYTQIKTDIGIKLFRQDNINLKTMLLRTQSKLDNLMKIYEWEF
jgi:hypothetical protein